MTEIPLQIPLQLPYSEALTGEDFLVAPCNQDAVGWINRWPEWPAPALVVYGPAASGKSHLAHIWSEKSSSTLMTAKNVLAMDLQQFAGHPSHLLIDRADFMIGEREVEEQLFHLYNLCRENNKSMLLTMVTPPQGLSFVIADLASRLRAAPAVEIKPPDESLLASILVKMFHDRQLDVGADVIAYVVLRMERSFAAARALVDQADRLALAEKKPVTIALLRRILMQE